MNNHPIPAVTLDKRFWKKKALVTFLLSILVFFIHNSSFYNYSNAEGALSAANGFLAHVVRYTLTEFSVPLYFIISGALFFRNYSSDQYVSKLKSRVRTLLIPYLMWNVIWLLFDIVTSYTFISNYFLGREKYELSTINVLLSIFHHKSNGPFWFLFDLIFFVLLTPVIDFLTRTKRRSIITITAAVTLCLMGWGLPSQIFFQHTAHVYYFIGVLVGKYGLAYFAQPSSLRMRVVSLLVLFVYGIHNTFFYNHVSGPLREALLIVQFVLCSWAFWNVCDWVPDDSIAHRFSDCSFAVYAMHANLGAVITKLLYLLLPKSDYFAIINFLLTILLTLLFVKLFCVILRKIMPRLYALLMGSR